MAGFGEKLSAELQARGLGARTLARMLDPTNVENEQRAVRRYLKGENTPRTRRREQIEAVLGLERGALEPDDEEESLAATLLAEVRSARPAWAGYDPGLARLRALATLGAPEGQLRETIIGLAAAHAVGQFFYVCGQSGRDGDGDVLRGASPSLPSRPAKAAA